MSYLFEFVCFIVQLPREEQCSPEPPVAATSMPGGRGTRGGRSVRNSVSVFTTTPLEMSSISTSSLLVAKCVAMVFLLHVNVHKWFF